MNITPQDFKEALEPEIARSSVRDRYLEIRNALVSAMQECMGGQILWDVSDVQPRHLATLRAYYHKRAEQFSEIGERLLANEMTSNAKIISAIARRYKIDIDFTKDLVDPDTVARMLSRTPAVRTTDYTAIMEPVQGGTATLRGALAAKVPRTPEALVAAGGKRAAAVGKRVRIIDVEPSLPPVVESPARPLGDIKSEYDRCWAQVASACKGTMPLITLTGADSDAPWWRMDHAPFQQKLGEARKTAKEMLQWTKAEKVDELLDRISALHAEKEQARATGRSKG